MRAADYLELVTGCTVLAVALYALIGWPGVGIAFAVLCVADLVIGALLVRHR